MYPNKSGRGDAATGLFAFSVVFASGSNNRAPGRLFVFQAAEEFGKREHQRAGGKVPRGVHAVPGQARGDPREGHLKVQMEKQRLRGGVERAVAQAVQRAHHHINGHGDLDRHPPRQQHGRAPQREPYI